MDYYVYEHDAESDRGIFYVGKGKYKRAWQKTERHKDWQAVIKLYPEYKVTILSYFHTNEEALKYEADKIAEYKSLGYNLVNKTSGGQAGNGEANKGRKRSEETKQKDREVKLGPNNPNYGKKWSEERRAKIKATWKIKPKQSQEEKNRKRREKYHSDPEFKKQLIQNTLRARHKKNLNK